MAKKPKREGKESGHWRPSRCTDAKVRRFMRHVARKAWDAASLLLGPYEGSKCIAEFLTGCKDRESAVLLARRGIPTIGDIERRA